MAQFKPRKFFFASSVRNFYQNLNSRIWCTKWKLDKAGRIVLKSAGDPNSCVVKPSAGDTVLGYIAKYCGSESSLCTKPADDVQAQKTIATDIIGLPEKDADKIVAAVNKLTDSKHYRPAIRAELIRMLVRN